jgi:cytochrome c-type biogenesis protein CcmE
MRTIPEPTRRTASGKSKFYAGGALIILAIGMLIFNGVRTGGNYYLTLDELSARESRLVNQGVRVNAVVDKESVHYDSRAISLSFDLVNPESGVRRPVVYNEPMPDLFMKSESVIVEGLVSENGTLEAHTILVKCPSKYEEAKAEGETVPAEYEY